MAEKQTLEFLIAAKDKASVDLDRVTHKVAELRRRLAEPAPRGFMDYLGGQLRGAKGALGEESNLGMIGKALRGAGALAGVTMAAQGIKQLAEGADRVKEALADANKNWADVGQAAISAVPIFSMLGDAGAAVNEAFTGRQKAINKMLADAAAQDAKTAAGLAALAKLKDSQGNFRAVIQGLDEVMFARRNPDVVASQEWSIKRADDERQKKIIDARDRAVANVDPALDVKFRERELDRIEKEMHEAIDKSRALMLEELGKINQGFIRGLFSSMGKGVAGAGAAAGESAGGILSYLAKATGGGAGMFMGMASGPATPFRAITPTELPSMSSGSGIAESARDRLNAEAASDRRENARLARKRTEAAEKMQKNIENIWRKIEDFNPANILPVFTRR
jgi:hypothetical protein